MMDIFLLYLFTRLNAMIVLFLFFGASLLIALLALSMSIDFADREEKPGLKAWRKRCLIALPIVGLITALIPSQKDAAIMLAGYGVLAAAKTDDAKRIAGKSVQLIEQTIDAYLAEKKKAKP